MARTEHPKRCPECGAAHLFFLERGVGDKMHSGPKETVVLRCHVCKAPVLSWEDDDSDHFMLRLEADVRAERRREDAQRRNSLSRNPMLWIGLLCLAVTVWVVWRATRA